jgi:hypothetical protein
VVEGQKHQPTQVALPVVIILLGNDAPRQLVMDCSRRTVREGGTLVVGGAGGLSGRGPVVTRGGISGYVGGRHDAGERGEGGSWRGSEEKAVVCERRNLIWKGRGGCLLGCGVYV